MRNAHPGFDVDMHTGRVTVRQAPPQRMNRGATAARMYSAARQTRNTTGFGTSTTSADAELASSLTALRSRSRQMVRDSAYARRARDLVVNNVIGHGMGIQAQVMGARGDLRKSINDSIEREWREWCAADSCHTGGVLHFGDLERAALAQVFEAGECLIRAHDRAFGNSRVPLALELIESERVVDGIAEPGGILPGNEMRMGFEVDSRFGRPQAAWIARRHPGDIRHTGGGDLAERVPASQLYHLRIVTRWPQTRGEPWLHCVVRKLDDMNEATALELTAARGAAAYFATIKSPEEEPDEDEVEEDGTPVMVLDPLTIRKLDPGEELDFHAPNRPNAQLDPFMKMMLREVATGTNTSYASLSGDYTNTNYSGGRLALLDDRDGWRALQQWWIRAFRMPLHKRWVQQAALAGAIDVPVAEYAANMAKFEAVRFKPRGWAWVDPTKEVKAYKEGVMGGLTTLTDVIAATGEGRDIEDFIATRKRELELLGEAGILTDTEVKPEPKPAPKPPAAALPDPDEDEDDQAPAAARGVHPMLRTAA